MISNVCAPAALPRRPLRLLRSQPPCFPSGRTADNTGVANKDNFRTRLTNLPFLSSATSRIEVVLYSGNRIEAAFKFASDRFHQMAWVGRMGRDCNTRECAVLDGCGGGLTYLQDKLTAPVGKLRCISRVPGCDSGTYDALLSVSRLPLASSDVRTTSHQSLFPSFHHEDDTHEREKESSIHAASPHLWNHQSPADRWATRQRCKSDTISGSS
ncbi:hypothetical protein P7K49_039416, partial [Saguinus oedipus]